MPKPPKSPSPRQPKHSLRIPLIRKHKNKSPRQRATRPSRIGRIIGILRQNRHGPRAGKPSKARKDYSTYYFVADGHPAWCAQPFAATPGRGDKSYTAYRPSARSNSLEWRALAIAMIAATLDVSWRHHAIPPGKKLGGFLFRRHPLAKR